MTITATGRGSAAPGEGGGAHTFASQVQGVTQRLAGLVMQGPCTVDRHQRRDVVKCTQTTSTLVKIRLPPNVQRLAHASSDTRGPVHTVQVVLVCLGAELCGVIGGSVRSGDRLEPHGRTLRTRTMAAERAQSSAPTTVAVQSTAWHGPLLQA